MSTADRSPLREKKLISGPGSGVFREMAGRTIYLLVHILPAYMAFGFILGGFFAGRVMGFSWTLAIGLVCLVAAAFWFYAKYKQWERELNQLRLGMQGEQAVAAVLAELGRDGYIVLHDLVGPRGNIDHLLIGPAGVIVIESKTRSKPARRTGPLRFDGRTITDTRGFSDSSSINQCQAQCGEVRRVLNGGEGLPSLPAPVRGVVIFPGWYIENTAPHSDPTVLNEKLIFGEIRKLPKTLTPQQVTHTFERIIRQYAKTPSSLSEEATA